jgi:hypothetical protein
MAGVVASAIGELGTLLGGTGVGTTLARGALTGIAAIGASQLLTAIEHDLTGGNPAAAAQARHVPQYAIVDLHSNKVVRTLSSKHVYSILTHPRGHRSRARQPKVMVLAEGERAVSVSR